MFVQKRRKYTYNVFAHTLFFTILIYISLYISFEIFLSFFIFPTPSFEYYMNFKCTGARIKEKGET